MHAQEKGCHPFTSDQARRRALDPSPRSDLATTIIAKRGQVIRLLNDTNSAPEGVSRCYKALRSYLKHQAVQCTMYSFWHSTPRRHQQPVNVLLDAFVGTMPAPHHLIPRSIATWHSYRYALASNR
ncbi:hypothetical protein COCC4DRAFT_26143 [Bipolaris maydis ATCC 48331]|uniref:Uncharacterized protein n=2 Tax=Cochliobolus heterostrophus TaxID=5016 RepID=M2THE5_COCH5|nr:uncharacterized protein COCC4DRAFT_26143 [Bipolaris maydis ATCC 48331]EMD85924.1 hypothetical protein COCHEDRAFT_1035001 [Bipolaris maydis C5]ENI01925.1 hypothetical protein COCC4DRAFT_26143 [Bipolaris maydis ATCC 48331]